MQRVYPDYYRNFRCISHKCRHNCCIGWEVDIDSNTAELYKNTQGDFGEKLKKHIDFSTEPPHFILAQDERCPFLSSSNLCAVITNLGEDKLCTICAEHPRFHNQLPDRIESGLGLCCEEAARLILTHTPPVTLVAEGDSTCEDEIIKIRDKAIELLQDRSKDIDTRVQDMLSLCGAELQSRTLAEWADLLQSLERLDEKWTELLMLLREKGSDTPTDSFDLYMQSRQTEYEQLLVYFTYRHLANACDLEEVSIRAAFAALCYKVIYTLGAVLYEEKGSFTQDDQIDLCRMFSCEIEYSDENLYIILDSLYYI